MRTLWQDVRYGLRMLARSPGFTAVAALSLAVGIGLNSVMFSFVDQAGFQRLPVREPERIVSVSRAEHSGGFAYADRGDFAEQCGSFADVVAMIDEMAVTDYRELPGQVLANAVSRNYFDVLGQHPTVGRFFSETEDRDLSAEPVVVLSYRLWQRDFGGDPAVVGKSIGLSGRTLTVIGVAPKGFAGTRRYAPEDCWIPAEAWHTVLPKMLTVRTITQFNLLARLRPGVSLESAQAEATVVADRLAAMHRPGQRGQQIKLSPILPARGADFYMEAAGVMALPALVLAIACANVSGLLIARATTRVKETAVRTALGGGRLRIIRQMLTENLILSCAGGALGVVLAAWAIRSLPALLPPSQVAPLPQVYMNWHLVGFAFGLSLLTTLLFGLLPAVRASRLELSPLLKADSQLGQSGGRQSGLNLLVVGQLAVSIVLLSVSGLFVRSLLHNLKVGPGFQLPDVLLVEVNPFEYGLTRDQIPGYLREVQDRLTSLAGVKRFGMVASLPLGYDNVGRRTVVVADDAARSQETHAVGWNRVAGDVLSLLRLRIVHGRDLSAADDASSERVTLINQKAAESLWPGQDPVDKWLRLDSAEGTLCRVVGVVEDGPYCVDDGASKPYLFLPMGQHGVGDVKLLLDAGGGARAMMDPVRRELRQIDDRVRPTSIQTLHEHLRSSHFMFGRRLMAQMFGAFGVLGLVLAMIGLYAVIAHAVGRRTREIGIRMAVGANRKTIIWMVLRRGLTLASIGVAVGLPIAVVVAQLFRSSLFGFKAYDPLTFAAVVLILILVSLLASLVPARRAAKVDPMVALRCE